MRIKYPSVVIVILTWNDSKNTIECLDSVFKSDYPNYDILLVDNNSDYENFNNILTWCKKRLISTHAINFEWKNTKSKKRNKRNKLFIYQSNKIANFKFAKNLGVAGGYNIGFNYALKKKYEFFIRIDCDFLITKNLISGMVKTFLANQEAVAVSPKVYYYIKKKTKMIWWTNFNYPKNYFRFVQFGRDSNRRIMDIGQFKGISTSDTVCGCCVMYKSKIIKKIINNFPKRKTVLDEDFFYGPEDMEISDRLKKHGKILVNLNYYAYHKVSRSILVSGVKEHIYFTTLGWLFITKKICNRYDQIIMRIYFLLKAIISIAKVFYKKNKNPHIGFLLGLRDYFLKY
jgi:GT2 family glycosyltransferase